MAILEKKISGNKAKLFLEANFLIIYGNTGCGVFKRGIQNLKGFCPRINISTQRKLLNFENWVNGEVSKIGHHFRK